MYVYIQYILYGCNEECLKFIVENTSNVLTIGGCVDPREKMDVEGEIVL